MAILDPIALLGGIRKLWEDRKKKEVVTSRLVPEDEPTGLDKALLTGGTSWRQEPKSRDPNFLERGYSALATKADEGLTGIGMNPNDKEGFRMMLGILGAGLPSSQAVNLAQIFTEDPKSIEAARSGPQEGLGIGRGIMMGRKNQMSPERWKRYNELYQKRFRTPVEGLNAQRYQQEDVPFGISQARSPFWTTQERADRDNFYSHGYGSAEGGPTAVKESFAPKMPLDFITPNDFIGNDLLNKFTGGGFTGRNWAGKYVSDRVGTRSADWNKLYESTLSPHEYKRAKNARAETESLTETTGAKLANRGGIDWIFKQTPPFGSHKTYYPTQLVHSDFPEISNRMRRLYDFYGLEDKHRGKFNIDPDTQELVPLVNKRGQGVNHYSFDKIMEQANKEKYFTDLEPAEQKKITQQMKAKWKTDPYFSPYTVYGELSKFLGNPIYAISELKGNVSKSVAFKALPPETQQGVLKEITDLWKKDPKIGYYDASDIAEKAFDEYSGAGNKALPTIKSGPSDEYNQVLNKFETPSGKVYDAGSAQGVMDMIDEMDGGKEFKKTMGFLKDTDKFKQMTPEDQLMFEQHATMKYFNSPGGKQAGVLGTLLHNWGSTNTAPAPAVTKPTFGSSIPPLYSYPEIKNSTHVTNALKGLDTTHKYEVMKLVEQNWDKDKDFGMFEAVQIIQKYKKNLESMKATK